MKVMSIFEATTYQTFFHKILMSTPFSQTTRFLETDTTQTRIIWLVIIAVLLSGWLAWGFLSQVTLFEVSHEASLTGTSTVVAQFSPAVQGRLHPGQMARVRLDSYPWLQYGTVPAVVTSVPRTPHDGALEVRLTIGADPPPSMNLDFGLTGVVEIAVEEVSPAELLLRAAGRGIGR